jgi:parallel beta-helix repeat protein
MEENQMENEKPARRVSSLALGMLIIFSAMAVMNFVSTNVRAADENPYWFGDHYIYENTTYPTTGNDSTSITLENGNLIICDNVTLTFKDNVTIEMWNTNQSTIHGYYGIQVNNTATFKIISPLGNTTIKSQTGYEGISYKFTNSGTLDFRGAAVERVFGNPSDKANTGGIRNLPGSVCNLTRCNIQDADTHSLYVEGNTTNGTALNIADCVITNTTSGTINGTGISIKGNSIVVIDSVTVSNTTGYGIGCEDAEDITIQNNSIIQNSATDGIYLTNSNVTIQDCNVNNNSGHGIFLGETNGEIKNSEIYYNGMHGVNISRCSGTNISTVTVEGNDIKWNIESGINNDEVNATIINNTISFNGVDLLFSDDIENGENGWAVSGDGHWEIVEDNYHSSTHSWRYHIGNDDYDNGTRNWGEIKTPSVDLSDVENAVLTFWSWFETESGRPPNEYDLRNVTLTVNDVPMETYPICGEDNKTWIKHQIDISDYVGEIINILFEFDTIDEEYNDYQGWYIDDVEVLGAPSGLVGIGIYNFGDQQSLIDDNIITSNVYGIIIDGSSDNCTISNNNINGSMYYGIWAHISSATISHNNISCSRIGINLDANSNATISNNNISFNEWGYYDMAIGGGIVVNNSCPIITENLIENNKNGVKIIENSNVTITRNMFMNNSHLTWHHGGNPPRGGIENDMCLDVNDSKVFVSENFYDETNSISLVNSSGIVSDNYILLANGPLPEVMDPSKTHGIMIRSSSSIHIMNNTILRGGSGYWHSIGIDTRYCTELHISENTITPNGGYSFEFRGETHTGYIDDGFIEFGLCVMESNSLEIKSNTIDFIKNNYGVGGAAILLDDNSNSNDISCNALSNNDWGIIVNDSSNNTLTDNDITENSYYGIYLNDATEYNSIYHNNFIYNRGLYTPQAYDNGSTTNSWDNGYPDGGNYWSDYDGDDEYGGPGQNLSGSDGIGDTPYDIDNDLGGISGPQDNYPMMYENRDSYTYWAITYGNGSNENLYWKGIHQTSDDGYIVAGYTNSDGAGGDDFWVLKLNETGNVTWEKTYGGPSNDEANAIIETSDGKYVVAGYTYSYGTGSPNTADVWVIKLNEKGEIVWNYTYGGSGTDSATSIVEADEGYVVAGYTCSYSAGYTDYWVFKIDIYGTIIWNKTYGGGNTDAATYIIKTDDGGYIVAGYTDSFGAGYYDCWLLKLNGWGNTTWNKTYGSDIGDDMVNSIIQTSDGEYVVCGYSYSFGDGFTADYWLLELDENGSIIWENSYGDDEYDDFAVSVTETSDGHYAVVGYTYSFGAGSCDYWILNLYPNGTVNWQKTYGGAADDYGWVIEQTTEGGYIVGGYTGTFGSGNNSCDLWILKIGPTGGITFDYNSTTPAYVGITTVTNQSTSCTVGNASTCSVYSGSLTPGTTSGRSKDVNLMTSYQATPSYGWYPKD